MNTMDIFKTVPGLIRDVLIGKNVSEHISQELLRSVTRLLNKFCFEIVMAYRGDISRASSL